ncbi:FAD-dependent oxidoreductase [Paenibacillus hodogayensis]|uniref:FAD-dependent oxidoreductase n=1 Tax=Paenibacillus hodogayensis TaxID=279208 RepID=A0ABV5W3Q2_9BACL
MKLLYRLDKQGMEQPVPAGHSFPEAYDIAVVGLGTAGALAAISAARRGHRVLGIERLNCMGGTGTAGTVQGYYFGSRGGLYEALDEEVAALGHHGFTKTGGVNGELKKAVLEKHASEAGVTVLYECSVIGVYMDGEKTVGLRWLGPDGLCEAGARVIIDCTGDAEVCVTAGGAFRMGRSSDGQCQPFSNVIKQVTGYGVHQFYTDSGYVDPTDGDSISQAIIDSALRTTHLKDRYEAKDRLIYVAPQLGIREGRFIDGEYNITLDDFLQDRLSDQPVFYAYSNLDNHSKDVALESESYQDWIVAASLWGLNVSVPVPLGALIPRQMDGMLVAGRCIALDHDMATLVRMKRDMQKCGEAAGIAASLAIELDVPLRGVPHAALSALLRSTGCLDERNHVGLRLPDPAKNDLGTDPRWLAEIPAIRLALASDRPGIAIWSAKRLGARINDELRQWLLSGESDEQLRRHSAIALALQEDRAAVPLLRQMVRERDSYVPRTSRKYNQVRGYAAIYLLGRLADAEIVPELLNILSDRDSFANVSTDVEFINSDEEYYFQFFTFSLTALFRIGDKHVETRQAIARAVGELVVQPDFALSVTLKPSKDQHYEMTGTILRLVESKLRQWGESELPAPGTAPVGRSG